MNIRIYDDKKEKWQSIEARLYEDGTNDLVDRGRYEELVGYGQDEEEAIANLKGLVYQHISDLEQQIRALTKIDFSKHAECDYNGKELPKEYYIKKNNKDIFLCGVDADSISWSVDLQIAMMFTEKALDKMLKQLFVRDPDIDVCAKKVAK